MSTTHDVEEPTEARPFSDVVRTVTFSDHEAAAMSRFMTALFERSLSLEAYTAMVAQHWYAYVVLEQAADRLVDHPVAGAFAFEELRRVPTLEADLRHLLGGDWHGRIEPSGATTRYCARIEQQCALHPEAFVAHHYTRYLGDLSGGQMIGRIAREVYDLSADAGAAFYEFPGIDDLSAFKDEYRRRLDVAEWSEAERSRLLDEVVVAYRLNTEVFDDLDREHMGDGPT